MQTIKGLTRDEINSIFLQLKKAGITVTDS